MLTTHFNTLIRDFQRGNQCDTLRISYLIRVIEAWYGRPGTEQGAKESGKESRVRTMKEKGPSHAGWPSASAVLPRPALPASQKTSQAESSAAPCNWPLRRRKLVTTTIITTVYYIEYLLLAWHFVQSFSNTNTSDARNTSPRQVLLFIDRLGEVKLSAQGHPVLAGDKGRNWIRVCPLAMSGLDYFTRRSPFYLLAMTRLGVPKIDSTKELRKKQNINS